MRHVLLISIAVCVAGCSSVQTRVRGELLVQHGTGAPMTYEYSAVESHSTGAVPGLCALTAIFYGGACWAFLGFPNEGQRRAAVAHAQEDGPRFGRCTQVVGVGEAQHVGWDTAPRAVRVYDKSGHALTEQQIRDLCSESSASAR